MTHLSVVSITEELQSRDTVLRLFSPKAIEISAPEGAEIIAEYERLAHRALIDNGRIHQRAIDQIIAIMGNATIMRFADGSYYAREVIQRPAFTIKPEPYSALVFHGASE